MGLRSKYICDECADQFFKQIDCGGAPFALGFAAKGFSIAKASTRPTIHLLVAMLLEATGKMGCVLARNTDQYGAGSDYFNCVACPG